MLAPMRSKSPPSSPKSPRCLPHASGRAAWARCPARGAGQGGGSPAECLRGRFVLEPSISAPSELSGRAVSGSHACCPREPRTHRWALPRPLPCGPSPRLWPSCSRDPSVGLGAGLVFVALFPSSIQRLVLLGRCPSVAAGYSGGCLVWLGWCLSVAAGRLGGRSAPLGLCVEGISGPHEDYFSVGNPNRCPHVSWEKRLPGS